MSRDREPDAVQRFGGCMLCEEVERPPIAVCRRCGAFVCRKHALKLVYPPSEAPVSLMGSKGRKKRGYRQEMVCEVCYLNEVVAGGEAV